MKISLLPSRIRAMRRYHAIFRVLIKYGFEEILERLRAEGGPGLPRKLFIRRETDPLTRMTTQKRLRLAIEERLKWSVSVPAYRDTFEFGS